MELEHRVWGTWRKVRVIQGAESLMLEFRCEADPGRAAWCRVEPTLQ